MKTADFLAPKLFSSYLDKRRTPRRLAIIALFSMLCVSAQGAVQWEADRQATKAQNATRPNDQVRKASESLQKIYTEMTKHSERLDPLAEHLKLPRVGWILAGLPKEGGSRAEIEQIEWRHQVTLNRSSGATSTEVVMEVTAAVIGDELVNNLHHKLQGFTEYEDGERIAEEVIYGRNKDAMRIKVMLVNPLVLPKAYRRGQGQSR